jgi:hypothetical protein
MAFTDEQNLPRRVTPMSLRWVGELKRHQKYVGFSGLDSTP